MVKKKTALKVYTSKRRFDQTPEPPGRRGTSNKQPIFVIQKHDARSLHYDFRLEDEGVLKSWAIPKGPSTNPKDKRLAVRTEDHPLGYAQFEGVIPPGNYGAGPVIIWDTGTFKNLKEPVSLSQCIDNGEITVWLEGKKLKGGYALIKTQLPGKNSWLLVKMADNQTDRESSVTKDKPHSVVSNCTIEEVEKHELKCIKKNNK